MGVHDGHRERMKESFKKGGFDAMSDINALEMLLYYAIPRKDTNVIAHALLARFGSLTKVFDASIPELCEVDGVGESCAVLLNMVPQIVKKSMVSDTEKIVYIRNSKEAGDYLVPRFAFERDEVALVLFLDTHNRIICCKEVSRGVVNSVSIDHRKIAEMALKNKATSVVLAHNHPDAYALPSAADNAVTENLYRILNTVGVTLKDHIIVSGKDYISYSDSGAIRYFR